MTRAIHRAPAAALRQALEASGQALLLDIVDRRPDLSPDIPVSTRNKREAAATLRKAADVLDLAADRAADRAEAPDEASGPGDRSHPRPLPR